MVDPDMPDPPRTYDDELMPEPWGHMYRMIQRLTEHVGTSDADTQKKFDFILEQQAQLTATVGRLAEKTDRISDKVDRTAGSITSLLAAAEIQAGEINALFESLKTVDDRTRRTDERLDVLVGVVERIITEGRNGQA